MENIRIQKIIADSGFCSRRKAEELIEQKRVKVNGHFATIGQKVDARNDLITIDGERILVERKREFTYLMMNKPRGYLTSMSDDRGRRCVTELLPESDQRLFPIGRLDLNSEGLLLFTNDGRFANQMMHPSHEVTKTYRVTVRPDITDEQAAKLSEGVYIDGRKTAPAMVHVLTKEANRVVIEMVIREGRNRQIRKMCEAVNLEVARLKRTAIGPIRLGMLKPGTTRELTKEELMAIRNVLAKNDRVKKFRR
ncbi:pseudouridine synthase [Paludicola sp. MB14-C6]|uniref:pseudouridine synthase n=1 Tax=Paludihabitans sp. MB14-C6 TaxID=3070656 RepID=UPI0027DC24DA|nr:pseudouridine synthase [Paludicola sp. MB14-C6]WMJ22240.1 pseudouridine synthase [Paludicola sp. MB14-C6]